MKTQLNTSAKCEMFATYYGNANNVIIGRHFPDYCSECVCEELNETTYNNNELDIMLALGSHPYGHTQSI